MAKRKEIRELGYEEILLGFIVKLLSWGIVGAVGLGVIAVIKYLVQYIW